MDTQYCNVNVMMNGNYFDITHSFKIDSSTYHVLGLCKERPTYGNTYYIFNCTCDQAESTKYGSTTLPFIHRSRESEYRSFTATHTRTGAGHDSSTGQAHETTSARDRTRAHTASQKKSTNDTTAIKQTLVDVLKTEHKSLISSLRKEINEEKNTLLRSIEKETKNITQAKTVINNDKQEILHLLEEKISTLQRTYEKQTSSIVSSIEVLKSAVTDVLNAQHEPLQSFEQLQLTLSKMIEREIDKIMVKHLETYRSTSVDINAIKQLENTLIETFEKRSITKRNDDDDNNSALKYLLAEQTQHLTDLITKHQQTYSLDSNVIKQLQSIIMETMEKHSITKRDNNDVDMLNRLFSEQKYYLTELITKQQQAFSVNLIKETVAVALKEQMTTAVTTTSSIDVAPDRRPFKISIKTAEFARVFAKLLVGDIEHSRELHTLCQRDPFQADVVNCFVAPPMGNEPFELTIYAKTNSETEYRAALSIQMPYPNIAHSITFPHLYQPFRDHQCILIEPLQRLLKQNEQVLIHMVIPGVREVKIRNGDEHIILNREEFRNGIVRKKIQVRGDLVVCGRWNETKDIDICAFEMEGN